MTQRSISSFFFKGPAVGTSAAPAPAPDVATTPSKRARDEASHDDDRDGSRADARDGPVKTPRLTDRRDPGVGSLPSVGDDAESPPVLVPARASPADVRVPAPGERDPNRRDAMRARLGETAKESKQAEVRERFKWLDPRHVVDADGRRPDHPDHDPRTVRVPADLKLSSSQRQYWDLKSKYRDVVLFFKVGKFYELYEDDAEIGCAALDWKMTVSGVGHCRQVGCPESGVDAAVAELVRRGYRVGRVEQMETAAQAKARTGSKTAVIRRELAGVITPVTAVDGDLAGGAGKIAPDATHVLAFAEARRDDAASGEAADADATIGFAFLDAAAGRLRVGSFRDDASRAGLATLLSRTAPAEVLTRRGAASAAARVALAKTPSAPRVVGLTPGTEFPEDGDAADEALDALAAAWDEGARGTHREGRAGEANAAEGSGRVSRFSALRSAVVRDASPAARAATAALATHLDRLKCASALAAAEATAHAVYAEERVRLDGPTLRDLELLATAEGRSEGSLLARVDACCTPAGSRTLRRWIAAPLRDPARVAERQDAVAALGGTPSSSAAGGEAAAEAEEAAGRLRRALRRAPDLERCVGRARAASAASASDARALPPHLAAARHARRVAALAAATVAARDTLATLRDFSLRGADASALTRRLADAARVSDAAEASLGACAEAIAWPRQGTGRGTSGGKSASASAPRLRSVVDGAFSGDDHDAASDAIAAAERETDRLLSTFLEHALEWSAAASAAAQLDALAALATFAAAAGGPVCRPEFVSPGPDGAPVFDAKDLWHPCAVASAAAGRAVSTAVGASVVPNDVVLGAADGVGGVVGGSGSSPPAMLLTGPNMGGKSTLLRATCVAAVLAHVGALVPASRLVLSPVDAVHTRLGGAGDRVDAGESTFLVECAEASAILRGATRDSLVVLDELGRGTSTFDGYAVAHASFARLAHGIGCRTMFATHFHALTREFAASPAAQLRHMAAEVGAEGTRDIAFLYKLREGACPSSHGTRVAALAGVPARVLARATEAAKKIEARVGRAFEGALEAGMTEGERNALAAVLDAAASGGGDDEKMASFRAPWTSLR